MKPEPEAETEPCDPAWISRKAQPQLVITKPHGNNKALEFLLLARVFFLF